MLRSNRLIRRPSGAVTLEPFLFELKSLHWLDRRQHEAFQMMTQSLFFSGLVLVRPPSRVLRERHSLLLMPLQPFLLVSAVGVDVSKVPAWRLHPDVDAASKAWWLLLASRCPHLTYLSGRNLPPSSFLFIRNKHLQRTKVMLGFLWKHSGVYTLSKSFN